MSEHRGRSNDDGDLWLGRALGLAGGETPFPWQIELLRRFRRGESVDALDIPTGLGKTATMAIWLVARALGADVPRRLVYVVDRRAVVDQATDVAESLRAWVAKEPAIAASLRLDGRPLSISTLRGQYVDNREWLEDPSRPAIIVGTVDMVGSRLLFEGYRSSRRMRPYQAALLGADALILLDEAHLVPPFEALVRSAVQSESLKPQGGLREVVPTSRVISLSATGRAARSTLQLGPSDREHDVVRRRLSATKRIRIADSVDADGLADALASKAWQVTGAGKHASRVIIFVDSRKTAQDVSDALKKLAKGESVDSEVAIETELFVGGRRVAEREDAAKRLASLGVIAGCETHAATPVFVVATSAGEVGVDLDADHAVLDLVEWERTVQRLGRVNRRGKGAADVWVVPLTLDDKTKEALAKEEKIRARSKVDQDDDADADDDDDAGADDDDAGADDDDDGKPPKKLKEDERTRVERWRRKEATRRAISSLPQQDGAHDGSPRALTDLKRENGTVVDAGSTPSPLHPELTRAVVQAWSMTSLEEHAGRPDIRPWLRGWVDEEAQTAVAWRRCLPRSQDAKAFFEAAPVEVVETLETESTTVLDWILKRVKQLSKAREEDLPKPATDGGHGERDELARSPLALNDVALYVLDESPRGRTLAELEGLDDKKKKDLLREFAGATVVVDVRIGGLSESGLLDLKRDTASDVSESEPGKVSFRVLEVDELASFVADGDRRVEETFVARTNDEGEPTAWFVVETELKQQSTTADGRSTGREQALEEHQAFAERHARAMGERLGLRSSYIDLLALAAVLHDEGKKAERWQRAFRAPKEKRPLGKTTSRPIQSILAGYRHDLGSLFDAERDARVRELMPDERDLVLHLIAAHHGFARPILRTDGCDAAPPSALVERARTIALRFARLEKRWGPWGLAWWETLLRAADQGASRENDERGGRNG